MMLYDFYKLGYFDYKTYVLDNLDKLELSTLEGFVLIKLLEKFIKCSEGMNIISVNNLSKSLSISIDEASTALNGLLSKNYIKVYFSQSRTELYDVKCFFEHVVYLYKNNIDESEISRIIALYEKEINRAISSSEYDQLSEILVEGCTYLEFSKAIERLKLARKLVTIRNIDACLKNNSNQDDIINSQAVSDFFSKRGNR